MALSLARFLAAQIQSTPEQGGECCASTGACLPKRCVCHKQHPAETVMVEHEWWRAVASSLCYNHQIWDRQHGLLSGG
jgi:hypothetical protein